MKIRLAGIVPDSIADGPGFRCAIFTQGCKHACKGCHNPETWSFSGGEDYEIEEIVAMWNKNPLLKGITLSGGDPFYQPKACAELAKAAHAKGLNVFSYTGFTFEELLEEAKKDADIASLLEESDYLVDGPFIEDLKDISLQFRGSSNQRIIRLSGGENV